MRRRARTAIAAGARRRGRCHAAARDRGSATVWVLGAGLLSVLIAMTVAAAGAAMVARHRAQSAADLAALAGALRAVEGEPVACDSARTIAAANGARVIGCRVDGLDITVSAEVTPAGLASLAGAARAVARAGPA